MSAYIDSAAVAAKLGLSRRTLYVMIQKKEFPEGVAFFGHKVGWFEPQIDEWLRSRPKWKPRGRGRPARAWGAKRRAQLLAEPSSE